jgi:aspartate racemase
MKTIGLIGGITPLSTILYYQILNDLTAQKYTEKSSCKVIINSFNFAEISEHQSNGRWDLLDEMMKDSGIALQAAGAECILICANTMHLCIEAVRSVVTVPVIHIADATGQEINRKELNKVALLGTKYTMEKTFYTDVLVRKGIETLIPELEDRNTIHEVIYSELAKGELNSSSKEKYLKIIDKLIKDGAEGIILGCTEIPLLIKPEDVSVPIFDTTKIHAQAGFDFIIS